MFTRVTVLAPMRSKNVHRIVAQQEVPSMLSDADKVKAAKELLKERGFEVYPSHKFKIFAP